ncbi:hypothetical protein [Lentibacillus salicampi]|uniref:Uncharacterized protein n=1 Tax=Lentibacillus salicampi TaxID=175306 RepID=A0A4Y9A973_9BACI|nr:hypothetical protein [Lentibacillus salicampi]TFJ92416.1 hypothetical protein E4U82_12255 [Lentibacillus salicampi]
MAKNTAGLSDKSKRNKACELISSLYAFLYNKINRLPGRNICEIMKGIINDGESVYEIDGKRYRFDHTEEPVTPVKENIKADPELRQKSLRPKQDIADGRVYATDEVMKMIEQDKA